MKYIVAPLVALLGLLLVAGDADAQLRGGRGGGGRSSTRVSVRSRGGNSYSNNNSVRLSVNRVDAVNLYPQRVNRVEIERRQVVALPFQQQVVYPQVQQVMVEQPVQLPVQQVTYPVMVAQPVQLPFAQYPVQVAAPLVAVPEVRRERVRVRASVNSYP